MISGSRASSIASTASSSGLDPASSPKENGPPYCTISSTTWRCWFTLMGYTPMYEPVYSCSVNDLENASQSC